MKTNKVLMAGAALAGLFGLTAVANADYVTYDFTGGSITISATVNGTTSILSGGVLQLNGGDVVFDPSAGSLQLESFSFTGATSSPMTLIGPLAGDMLSVSGLTIGPGSSYSVSGFGGTNPYSFLVNSIAASGSYSLTGPVAPAPHSGTFNETGVDNSSIAATVTLVSSGGWDVLGFDGVSLGSFTMGSGANARTVTLKGDITFDATPVPLPAGLWLLASGLGLLGFPFIRRLRRLNIGTALAVGLALIFGAAVSRPAQASTVIDVVPGAGSLLDQGALCLTSSALCPGNATDLNLQSPFPTVSGNFVYTPTSATSGTMSFTLTLTSNAGFGSQTMLAGSTFTASNIDVTESISGGTESISQVAQAGPAIVSNASMSFSSGLPVLEHTPAIADLNCQFTSSGGLCGVSLGGSLSSGLQFGPDPGNGGAEYNGFFTFDTTVTPVPLPPSFWLMLGGLGCLGLMRRRTHPAISAIRL